MEAAKKRKLQEAEGSGSDSDASSTDSVFSLSGLRRAAQDTKLDHAYLEARVKYLEADVKHLEADIKFLKAELTDMRAKSKAKDAGKVAGKK